MNCLWQKFFWTKRSQLECSWWVLCYSCDSANPIFLHGLSGRNMLNSFDMLIYASTTQKIVCSVELPLFSCIQAFIYQLIVKSMCAFVFVDAFYSCGPSSRSNSEWQGEKSSSTSSISRSGSKQLYPVDQNANPAFILFYLGVLPLYIGNVMGIAPPPMNSWYSDTSCHHYSSLGLHLGCNRNADKWTVMCEINTPSNSVAW